MQAPLKTIEHHKHLQHLTNMAPFLSIIFLGQCYLLSQFEMTGVGGNSYLVLGLSLASIMGLFMLYDSNHCVHLYNDHLWVQFKGLGINKRIFFNQVMEVTVIGDDPDSFGSVIIKLNDETTQVLYLVDEAHFVKAFIDEQRGIKGQNIDLAA